MQEPPADRSAARSFAPDSAAGQHLTDTAPAHHVRLLPWTADGKLCVLSASGPGSFLSRLADGVEDAQLDVGYDVLRRGCAVLADPLSPYGEVRYAGVRLAECLRDALGIAESRVQRVQRVPEPEGSEAENPGTPLA
ncbi:hypothetical protein [Streptomyces sp. NPDC059080]|uniref:hypothetical protein n=1 Tax=Streptomyces sp. NPDC059080 TaxID=3346718 RepID=UPI0036CD89D2